MKLSDAAWQDRWCQEPYAPPSAAYRCGHIFGTNAEPMSSLWCASLVAPLDLAEPFSILDWGSGDGRLFDFLAKRFRAFRYFGLERPGEFGAACVASARSSFGHDARAVFDVCGTITQAIAIGEAGSVVLGSVATHLPIHDFEAILAQTDPVLDRGGAVVASLFLGDDYQLIDGSQYGHADCYWYAIYTRAQIDALCARQRLTMRESDTFVAADRTTHHVVQFRRRA